MAPAFYEVDGELMVPSELTRGPWDPDAQHAGPPTALLGRALAALPTPDGVPMRIAKVSFEILRAVPIAPLRVDARIVRDGRRVGLLEASLFAGDDELIRASAWRIREQEIELGNVPAAPEPPTHTHADARHEDFFPTGSEIGYHTAVEYLFIAGAFLEPGPATVWMRSTVPLVAGEAISPLERVLVVADSGNGVSAVLNWQRFVFINVDLTVHLHRYPVGEWVLLEAQTTPQRDGIGFAEAQLSDEQGRIGRSAQSLMIGPR